jgi:hypothetical protein
MSQVALRAGKNHLRFGLVDYSQRMPPIRPVFHPRKSAAIEVTDARSMANTPTATSPLLRLKVRLSPFPAGSQSRRKEKPGICPQFGVTKIALAVNPRTP